MLALTAALLHDIGHGPLSRALEKATGIRHGKWTMAIVEGDAEVNKILRDHGMEPREVVEVIQRISQRL
ncbi:HD domain-containing protein [Gracilibacillus sp. JCM 18860]|uniref:HD domain-containing protein n=1 Tax=Gracilibacillus sp. JCM 18860 TaxID=1306159 RepID=UPI0006D1A139